MKFDKAFANFEVDDNFMNQAKYLLSTLVISIILFSCDDFGNKQNPLYGKKFKEIKDISGLENYKSIGGSVIESYKDKNGDHKFGIGQYRYDETYFIAFEEFLKSDKNKNFKNKILDTINISKIKPWQSITYCHCIQDTILDNELIAFVIRDDKSIYYDTIIKAWRADTKTGKIIPIKNLKSIKCPNEDIMD